MLLHFRFLVFFADVLMLNGMVRDSRVHAERDRTFFSYRSADSA